MHTIDDKLEEFQKFADISLQELGKSNRQKANELSFGITMDKIGSCFSMNYNSSQIDRYTILYHLDSKWISLVHLYVNESSQNQGLGTEFLLLSERISKKMEAVHLVIQGPNDLMRRFAMRRGYPISLEKDL